MAKIGNALGGNASDTWVTDTTAPTADIVDVTPDPRNAAVGLVTITFSENVTVASGTPAISLTIGATPRNATYLSGSGTAASYCLAFTNASARSK